MIFALIHLTRYGRNSNSRWSHDRGMSKKSIVKYTVLTVLIEVTNRLAAVPTAVTSNYAKHLLLHFYFLEGIAERF